MEGCSDHRVHLDEQVLLGSQVVVASLDDSGDPPGEGLAQHGVGDVEDPLAGSTADVAVFRQVVEDERVLASCLEDVLDAQLVILWAVEVLDVFAFDTSTAESRGRSTYYLRLPVSRSLRK